MADLKISEFVDGGRVRTTDQIATNRGGINNYVYVGSSATMDVGSNPNDIPTNAMIPNTIANTLRGTSLSTVAIALGTNTFFTQSGKSFEVGRDLTIVSDDNAVRAAGIVTAYDNVTGELTANIYYTSSSASKSSWNIFVSGIQGVKGDKGDPGDVTSGVNSVNGVTPDGLGNVQIGLGDIESAYTWETPQSSQYVSVSFSSTVTIDLAQGNNFTIAALTSNFTLANPTNAVAGMSGVIVIRQDATGGRAIIWGSNYLFSNMKPALSAAPNSVDYIVYVVNSDLKLVCNMIKSPA